MRGPAFTLALWPLFFSLYFCHGIIKRLLKEHTGFIYFLIKLQQFFGFERSD